MSKYNVKLQTEPSYKNIKYGQGTVYSAGCGPASLCNALYALDIANVSVPTMCSFAVSCGARVSGGTDMHTLLKNASKKYGFDYVETSKNAELWQHLKNGSVAIMNNGSQYKLFSDSGHFVTAIGYTGTSTVIVADSYWYSGKYTRNSIRRNYVTVVETGVVKTSLTQCGKATIDRNPSYYLISHKKVTVIPSKGTLKVTTEKLNVRSGAGTAYSILGTLNLDATCQKTGVTDNGWYQIDYKGKIGYVSQRYTSELTEAEKQTNKGEPDLTKSETQNLIDETIARIGNNANSNPVSGWAKNSWDAATDAGIVDGTKPQAPATREQVVQMLSALGFIGKIDGK